MKVMKGVFGPRSGSTARITMEVACHSSPFEVLFAQRQRLLVFGISRNVFHKA